MLKGKVALITGGGAGIGAASAEVLADEGAHLAIGFVAGKEKAEETAQAYGGIAVRIDVTSAEAVASAFDEVEKSLGPVDILVNNAGVIRDRLLMRMSENEWAEVLDVNLTGTFRCTKRALPAMLRSGWGRIINVGSVVGSTGNPGQANYAAAKAGLVGFTKSLAREVAAKGVTVNVVAPGLVDTALTENLSDSARQALMSLIPMRRSGTVEEIAEAVRFCARSSYLTGQVIGINGGIPF
ncbi:MAG: 3-oxoacyl-ACP reductase FabG [Actinomycetota bacterium]